MSRILYTNASGFPVKSHSYSGGLDFKCPKKYFYKRVQGWQSKEERPALEFGKVIESAIQYYHNTGCAEGSGVDEFKKLWWGFRDSDIAFTEKTGDWAQHYQMGKELLALYEQELPNLPIHNIKFQVNVKTDLFPGTEYEGLKYTTVLDMVSEVPEGHLGYTLLPPNGKSGNRKLIIDIKTSAASYYVDPRLSALDGQLRDYAWSTGIETVAFLVLVKNFTDITVGDWVTVLRGPKAGKKYQAFDITTERVLVLSKQDYDEYMSRKKGIKGKGAKEAIEILLTEYFYKGHSFSREDLTKQKIQFLPAVISSEDMAEAREVACREAMEISDCGLRNYYPKYPGVRFPSNQCLSCECLGLCVGDQDMIKEKLVQIGGAF